VVAIAAAIIALQGIPARFSPGKLQIVDAMEAARAAHVADYREGRCFIAKDALQDDVDASCIPTVPGAVLVWGDSYAAHLVPGLEAVSPPGPVRLGQLTAGACAPLIAEAVPRGDVHCARTNAKFLQRVSAAHPGVVVLSASWVAYTGDARFAAELDGTVRRLQAMGAKVVLVGQAVAFGGPQWLWAARHPDAARVGNSALPALRRADATVRAIAQATGAEFMSPLDALCVGSDCAVQETIDGRVQLMSWDTGHLTRAGSLWYARELVKLPSLAPWSRGRP
jgi:hypothetical protein